MLGRQYLEEHQLLATLRSEKNPRAQGREPKPEPAVTQEQLDGLEPGDTVFHKAFGYGRIIDIDEAFTSRSRSTAMTRRRNPRGSSCSLGRSPRVAADRIE